MHVVAVDGGQCPRLLAELYFLRTKNIYHNHMLTSNCITEMEVILCCTRQTLPIVFKKVTW